MKKRKKSVLHKIGGCLYAFLLLMTTLPVFADSVQGYNQVSAVDYAKSLIGQSIDVDNGHMDCVDIAKAYFKEVGNKPYTSLTTLCGSPYAYNYAYSVSDGAIPDGWERQYYDGGYRPQPGDVAVWGANVGRAGSAGHVAVVIEVDSVGNIIVVEQDSSKNQAATRSTPINASQPTCYIVPLFNQAVRYTVLVLDVSGPQTFEESPNYMNLWGTKYTSDSSIEAVKGAAQKFLDDEKKSIGKNMTAIVTYSDTASVVLPFTDNADALQKALDQIEYEEENRSIQVGLECAYGLLNEIGGNASKNLLLCTTGLTDCGDYAYEGWYNSDTIASDWQNKGTEIKLYAYANTAIESANKLKDMGTNLYVLGLFDPIEANMPRNSGIKDVASFLRMTARDLASSEAAFYAVNDIGKLDFVFEELREELAGSVEKRIFNDSAAYPDGSPWDDVGGSMGLGGYYEEFLWGPALFEVPSTQLFRSSIQPSDSVNYNLAMLCGCLCMTAANPDYLWQAYMDLGFLEEDAYLYSYPDSPHNRPDADRNGRRFADDGDLAFSIATQTMTLNGVETDLLVIVTRGTVTPMEAIKDGTCIADKEFYGYTAWDWIYEFEEDVFAGLEDFHRDHSWLGTRPMKILVTGHSLGGAAANLVAAKLDQECGHNNWYGNNLSIDNVYAYTFGAIDSITNEDYHGNRIQVPVSSEFPNIINIYNYLDTFGPDGNKVMKNSGFTAKGHYMYRKFGYFYTFTSDMKGVVADSFDMTHQIAGYVQAVKNGWLSSEYQKSRIRIDIMCPVDVEIYNDDTLICQIVSDQILSAAPEIDVCVAGSEKIVILPKEYYARVVITATDAGIMDYMVQDLDAETGNLVFYQNIALEEGKMVACLIPEEPNVSELELFVTDESLRRLAEISPDGTETETGRTTATAVEPEEVPAPDTGMPGARLESRGSESAEDLAPPAGRKNPTMGYALVGSILLIVALLLILLVVIIRKRAKRR